MKISRSHSLLQAQYINIDLYVRTIYVDDIAWGSYGQRELTMDRMTGRVAWECWWPCGLKYTFPCFPRNTKYRGDRGGLCTCNQYTSFCIPDSKVKMYANTDQPMCVMREKKPYSCSSIPFFLYKKRRCFCLPVCEKSAEKGYELREVCIRVGKSLIDHPCG